MKIFIELIAPKNLFLVAGRGMAKTTSIQAGRFIDISHDMNHSWFAWAATTYMDAMDNIVPVLIEGLKMHGWIEGKHYVVDEPPPSHFLKPYKVPKSYKHTISTFLGTFCQLVSMDQVTSAAGGSYQHWFMDEVKNIPDKKQKKLGPAIRGGDYMKFGRSPYYMGRTFTTDMPNITEGEYDYILDQEKNMDEVQIRKILEIAVVLNDIKIKYAKAYQRRDMNALKRIGKEMKEWKIYWHRARMGSTLFLTASSFANIDILTQSFFEEVLKAEGMNSFKTTILSLPPTVKKGEQFYVNLGEHHFYDDGVRESFYDNFNLMDNIKATSEALRYCAPNEPLELGVDFGNMCSMPVGQPRGDYYYILKDFYTLAPEETPQLAAKFRFFFRNHKNKQIDMYYDRSGNANRATKRDWASDLKYHLEFENEKPTGWTVRMMSLNQGNIGQEDEYNFMRQILGETVKGLPKIKIDKFQCPRLKSSIELAKIKIRKSQGGSTLIGKDKSSERNLALHQLPLYSTNMSDAFKYLLCRRDWMSKAGRRDESEAYLEM